MFIKFCTQFISSSKNNPNKYLQITLAGALVFHLLILMIVWTEVPPKATPVEIKLALVKAKPDPDVARQSSAEQLVERLEGLQLKKTQEPRKRTISSSNAQSKHDQNYMLRWQSYVESVGNQHYPHQALQKNIKGNLRLLVAINKNGSINAIQIRQSSGHPILDQAAIQIVQKAAPFEALPSEITQDVEVLEIIRTWQFNGSLQTA